MNHRALFPLLLALTQLPACWRSQAVSGGAAADVDAAADADTDVDGDTDGDTGSEVVPHDCDDSLYDDSTGLCWQDPKASDLLSWQEAIDYCDGLVLDGYADWFLPSRDDFIDLLGGCDGDVLSGDPGYCNACVESDTCDAMFYMDFGWYWSSTPYSSDRAWMVSFEEGLVYDEDTYHEESVRCACFGS
jgi:hypothetical protein